MLQCCLFNIKYIFFLNFCSFLFCTFSTVKYCRTAAPCGRCCKNLRWLINWLLQSYFKIQTTKLRMHAKSALVSVLIYICQVFCSFWAAVLYKFSVYLVTLSCLQWWSAAAYACGADIHICLVYKLAKNRSTLTFRWRWYMTACNSTYCDIYNNFLESIKVRICIILVHK